MEEGAPPEASAGEAPELAADAPLDSAAFEKEGNAKTSDEIECPDWLWKLESGSRWEGHVRLSCRRRRRRAARP